MPLVAIFRRIGAKARSPESKNEARPQTRAPRVVEAAPIGPPPSAGHSERPEAIQPPPRDGCQEPTISVGSLEHCDLSDALVVSHKGRSQESPKQEMKNLAQRNLDKANVSPGKSVQNTFSSSFGPFANASGFVINGQVNMIDTNQPIIARLAEKTKPEAIHDSSLRQYPPRCSENTRMSLRKDIVAWRNNPDRQERMRWYMGPAGVGKSAVAQSVAEELKGLGYLGGSFFFSRPGQIDDPATVIPTIAYQLATRNSTYRHIITQRLVDDPLLLTKNFSTQFNELITEPFQAIATMPNSSPQESLLIILDGLDECKGWMAQCELVQLILDHVRRVKHFPLLWLVCSRPEWHLKTIVSDADFPAACEKKEISVDDEEAQADARRILETELTKIQKQYTGYLPMDWPAKKDVDRLCKAASGHLGYASFMARFIGDAEAADPERQFLICVRVASGLGVDQGARINPLEALDLLYYRILCDVPSNTLPTTLRIISARLCGYGSMLSIQHHAHFLCLTQASYYGALKQLHSVISVPPPSDGPSRPLRFYHASFSDFLHDPIRSGRFHLSEGADYLNVAIQCLRWLKKYSGEPFEAEDPVFQLTHLEGWAISSHIPRELLSTYMDELASFDFGILQNIEPEYFAEFIRWLYAKAPPHNLLVRLDSELPNSGDRTLSLEHKVYPYELKDSSWRAVGKDAKNAGQQCRSGKLEPNTMNFYSPSAFANASEFIFSGQVNMYDTIQSSQVVIQRLAEKGKPEAIHDSSYREYPPRCHEDTRKSLRKDILQWHSNPHRREQMRWYMGPAGVGKSAIAQSVAEELETTGYLGGSFFFSRPGQIDDPTTVIPTLAYQLAIKNDLYKPIVTKLLADDPLILSKNRSIQFNKLIVEPFQAIATSDNSAYDNPLLMILDGLDECKGKEAQCELVQLILDHVGRIEKFPLLWLVCSRPEWHLKFVVADADFPPSCEKKEIDVDDYEAQADARRLFETEFTRIKKEYMDLLPADWPPRADVDRLCRAASGHLGFASFMARFIGDAEAGDPEKQLQICTRIALGFGVDQGTRINPFDALDCLYHRILSDVHANVLPVTMRILSLCTHEAARSLPDVQRQAEFLGLAQVSFFGALKQLHSVSNVPSPARASVERLRFYHASFVDFLQDPVRSGKFHITEGVGHHEVAIQCLQWLKKNSDRAPDVRNPIFLFTRSVGWRSGCRVPDELLQSLMDELMSFDFGNPQFNPILENFAEFIRWLYTKISFHTDSCQDIKSEREAYPSKAQDDDANKLVISPTKHQGTPLQLDVNEADRRDIIENIKAERHKGKCPHYLEITSQTQHLDFSLSALQALPKNCQQSGAEARNQSQHDAGKPPAPSLCPAVGPFANASGFVINGHVNMVDTVLSNQPVLQRLAEKGRPEAIHNSYYREYPPRCSENTRASLRNDVLQWHGNPNREQRLLWYMGPAGIGKSAIAQSIAEELEKTGHLGGTFFFSRPGQISDPATVIPTLAYQLAMRNNTYKQIVSQRLVDDLWILNKNRSTQFSKLIIEPFQIIATISNNSLQDPLLIILDGLDECKGTEEQCELVQLLLDHAGRIKQFPLLWLICSRPEWHFRTIVSDIDFPAVCGKKEVSVNDVEAQADARHLLERELSKIRKQYEGFLPADWPPRQSVDRLCRAASGHLGYVSFMARFIGSKEVGDPEKQFRICTRIASGLGVDGGAQVNPLEALDRLYSRVLSDIPATVLPVTMQILSANLNYWDREHIRHVRDQADYLLLTQAAYYGALRSLHSVLYIPLPSEASSKGLRFHHASFADFLRDPARSGKFHISRDTEDLDSVVRCIRWLGKHNNTCSNVNTRVLYLARCLPWDIAPYLNSGHSTTFIDEMRSFDFEKLQDPPSGIFVPFIRWLSTKAPPHELLVRLVDKPPVGTFRTLSVEHKLDTELFKDWVSDFFPDKLKQSPLSLHFLLGVSTQVHVHVTVHKV
ncbi:hypothetical protein D9756_004376 [Leucocoprinus leucothites]|uniref:Nephrocystin 3-like N-terminal domain-containing protein n=1 Tax=Leucocoprinus leucothites TaxID=201217 RepID=A0A8H5DBH9_9AGAR|nr:hypothetical protein D9756_004376 [Leucoagaricus leucothites]